MSTDRELSQAPPHLAEVSTVAQYRIVSRVGSGGMGEVYKAFDTKLGRTVALKILRPDLVRDRDKVARFAHEARAASSLIHPAIVTIYDVGETDRNEGEPVHYIAMEFVEGESLRRKLQQSISVPKILQLIIEVAEGLAKAHSAGVVHRDLKPDNIMVTTDGAAKIVDFGLAKLTQPDLALARQGDDGDTLSLYESRDGMVIGTIGYMSPEQIEGRNVDHRSDIFSLGCILYEGVTGRRAFDSSSIVETLHKIVAAEPAPIDQQPDLERVIRRCLKKDPEERFQTIKDLAIELREILRGSASGHVQLIAPQTSAARNAIVAAVVIAAGFAVMALLRSGASHTFPPYRLTPLSTDAAYEGSPAWSPDGKSVAYVRDAGGILQVFVRSLDSPLATQITHSPRDCREPFWDPQGNHVYYISLAGDRDSLWRVGLAGGSPEVVLENVYTAAISPDSKTLAFLREANDPGNFALALWIASPIRSAPTEYAQSPLRGTRYATGVIRFAPDNSKIALWVSMRESADRQFWIIPHPTGTPHRALQSLSTVPRPFPFNWMMDNRRIVFGADYVSATPGMHLSIADTVKGTVWPLTVTSGNESYPSISPNGKRIVFSTENADFDLITIPLEGNRFGTLLSTSRSEKEPIWSPARAEYAYVTNRGGAEEIWLRNEDGQWERPIVTQKDFGSDKTLLLSSLSFSPDGQQIAYQRRGETNYRVWVSPVAGGSPVPLTDRKTYMYEDTPTWSPKGDWIAYTYSDRRGVFSLAKVRVGGGSPPVLIKDNILYGSDPQWSPRGEWITVDLPDGLTLMSPGGERGPVVSSETWLTHAWSADGTRLYGMRLDDEMHLRLASLNVTTGEETLRGDFGPAPPIISPLRGFSLARDGKSFASSMPRLTGDLWILDDFDPPRDWAETLGLR